MFNHDNDLTINSIMAKLPDHSPLYRGDTLSISKSPLNNHYNPIIPENESSSSIELYSPEELDSSELLESKFRLIGIDQSNPRELLYHQLSIMHLPDNEICERCGTYIHTLNRAGFLCEICNDDLKSSVELSNGSSSRLL